MGSIRDRKVAKIQTEYSHQRDTEKNYAIQKRKRLVRRLSFFFLFAAVVSYFMFSTLVSQASSIEEKEAEKAKLLEELALLESKQMNLEEEIVKLNDDEYLAKIARRDYFLSEDNEVIFNIPEKKNGKSSE